ncbi:MAG: FG-GAP repeat protein [Armatimonadetes bacterium]|nr:FG-GAP repeat protein [Armatimonadota bacterium]
MARLRVSILLLTVLLLGGCRSSNDDLTSQGGGGGGGGGGPTSTLAFQFTPAARAVPEDEVNTVVVETFVTDTPLEPIDPNDPNIPVIENFQGQFPYNRNLEVEVPSDSTGVRLMLGDLRGNVLTPVLTGAFTVNLEPGERVVIVDPPLEENALPVDVVQPLRFHLVGDDHPLDPNEVLGLEVGQTETFRIRGGMFDLTDRVDLEAVGGIGQDPNDPTTIEGIEPGDGTFTARYFSPVPVLAVGPDAGIGPQVNILAGMSGLLDSFFAFNPEFQGGVRVAVGDVDRDTVPDVVTAAGAGGGPHVKVFSGADGSEIRSFFAYAPGFAGGVFVAAGDVNGDGAADIVTGAGAGGAPHVKVFSGINGAELSSFFPYDPTFAGGVRVAAGDVDGDGRADIITGAGPGGTPHVKVFSGATGGEILSFLAFDAAFAGGVFVAAGDVNGAGPEEVLVAVGSLAGPQVKVFNDQAQETSSFFAFDRSFQGGVRVAAGDVNGDGVDDVVAAPGPGISPRIHVFDGEGDLIQNFFAFDPVQQPGLFADVIEQDQPPPAISTVLSFFVQGLPVAGRLFVANGVGDRVTSYGSLAGLAADPNEPALTSLEGDLTTLDGPLFLDGDTLDQDDDFFVSSSIRQSILYFADGATQAGNTPPDASLGGRNTRLASPCGIAFDPGRGLVYVANHNNNSITVYRFTGPGDFGDVPPLRTITGFPAGPFGLALDPGNDRLYVSLIALNDIAVINNASGANATVSPPRFSAAGLQAPAGLYIDPLRQRLYVASQLNGVFIFDNPAGLAGIVNPTAHLTGDLTGFQRLMDVDIDLARDRLLVSDVERQSVAIFQNASAMAGILNVPPFRRLEGAATGLDGPAGLLVDPGIP